eukprot:TRINITY_DN24521_c0_g1_i1.p1 TRINITY_DN24521_c0_g1~~TRINITY_DN24521_c0_g1_i1.p1  ORF type:complete len:519 (+),score=105.40 TRINITY_DN24521_c0_g1_i1:143-1699(+)
MQAPACCAVMCVAVADNMAQPTQTEGAAAVPPLMWPVPVYASQQGPGQFVGPASSSDVARDGSAASPGTTDTSSVMASEAGVLCPPSQSSMAEQTAPPMQVVGQCHWPVGNQMAWVFQPVPMQSSMQLQGVIHAPAQAAMQANHYASHIATAWQWPMDHSDAWSSSMGQQTAMPESVIGAAAATGAYASGLRQRKRRTTGSSGADRTEVAKTRDVADDIEDDSCDEDSDPTAQQKHSEADRDEARRRADKLLQLLEDGATADAAAELLRMAFADQVSSRAAQLAIEDAPSPEAKAALVSGLPGQVREASRSMHANFVVQKIIEVMPGFQSAFIHRELSGLGMEVAKNRFGCRVMCRLLEHGALGTDPSMAALFQEVVKGGEALSRHTYGNYVVRHLLEFGLPWHKSQLAQTLCTALPTYARHRYGSRVVQMALQHCAPEERRAIFEGLLADPHEFIWLAKGLSGRHVVRALLRENSTDSADIRQRAVNLLLPHARDLEASKYGRLVLDSIHSQSSMRQ